MKLPMGEKMRLCPLCDENYDENGPDAKAHEHPEPQSGLIRSVWLVSGLPYEKWIKVTEAGRRWAASK